MSLAVPIRERVTREVLGRIEKIMAGDTYHYTPAIVTRALRPHGEYATALRGGPVYGVNRSDDSEINLLTRGEPLAHDLATSRVFEHLLVLDITGYVLGEVPPGDPADTKMQNAWADLFNCFESDPTLGGLVKHCEPYGKLITDRGLYESVAAFTQPWLFRFTERR